MTMNPLKGFAEITADVFIENSLREEELKNARGVTTLPFQRGNQTLKFLKTLNKKEKHRFLESNAMQMQDLVFFRVLCL